MLKVHQNEVKGHVEYFPLTSENLKINLVLNGFWIHNV